MDVFQCLFISEICIDVLGGTSLSRITIKDHHLNCFIKEEQKRERMEQDEVLAFHCVVLEVPLAYFSYMRSDLFDTICTVILLTFL